MHNSLSVVIFLVIVLFPFNVFSLVVWLDIFLWHIGFSLWCISERDVTRLFVGQILYWSLRNKSAKTRATIQWQDSRGITCLKGEMKPESLENRLAT